MERPRTLPRTPSLALRCAAFVCTLAPSAALVGACGQGTPGAFPPSSDTAPATTEAPAGSTADTGSGAGTLSTSSPSSPSSPSSATAAPSADASCPSCVSGALTWGPIGGNALTRDESAVAPCRGYTHTRTFSARAGGGSPVSCSASLACDASDAGTQKLDELVANADVQKALTTSMPVYGCDLRPADGTLLRVQVDGGRSFAVGPDCGQCTGGGGAGGQCVPVPAGVRALTSFLEALDARMVASEPCKSALARH